MILMYHNIALQQGFNTLPLESFTSHMQYLNQQNFKLVSLNQYVDALLEHKNKNLIAITFDDAYVSFQKFVVPIIDKLEIPVTVFTPVGLIGKYNVWDEHYGHSRISIMDWAALQKVNESPWVTIGTHGYNHISMNACSEVTLVQEVVTARKTLEEKLKTPIVFFSYPFGQLKDYDKTAIKVIKEEGFKAAVSTNWNRINTLKDLYHLNRIEILPTDHVKQLKNIIHRQFDYRLYKQLLKNQLYRWKLLK